MRPGKHNRKIDSSSWIRKLSSPFFRPYLKFNFDRSTRGTCGTHALSMLTGIKPSLIDKQMPKTNDYWTDLAMKRFLRSKGFKVTELTVSRVTNDKGWKLYSPVTLKHVLLIGQEYMYGEGTWAIIYDNNYYHNFDTVALSPLEFINNPTATVYVVSHKKWE